MKSGQEEPLDILENFKALKKSLIAINFNF